MFRIFFPVFLLIFFFSCNLQEHSKDTLSKEQVSMDPEKILHLKITSAEDYNQALDLMEKKDLKSLDIAIKLFQNAKADSLSRDSMLVGFNDFLSGVASTFLENNDSLQGRKGIDVSDEATRKLKERLAKYGMNLSTSEGEFYLEPDNNFLIENFGEKISSAYREFLTISAMEQQQKFAEDGAILIPADSIGKRIVTWENFMEKYPTFVSIGKVQDLYAQYMEAYLSGTDNSKVFDPSSNKLKDVFRQSFEAYIDQNPGKKSTSIIKGYYDLLKSGNFVYSEKVDSYILEKLYN